VNRAVQESTGRSAEEFIGRTNREIGMPEQLCDRWDANLALVFETARAQPLAFVYDSPDGPRQFQAVMVPELDDRGGVETVLCIAHDVTDIRRTESELRLADQRKDEFLAMLSHELRNPLAPLRNAYKLLDREPLSAQGRQALQISARQLHHVTRVVDDLLEVSRFARGKIRLRPERLVVQSVLQGVADAMAPDIQGRQQTLSLEMPAEPLWVTADPVRLAQIAYNLLTNACKHNEPGGRIGLRVRREPGGVAVEVEDDGVGIAADSLVHIFDLFSQVHATSDRRHGGLGIGLALVKRLAELHGGGVAARSDGIGRGATFTVTLPNNWRGTRRPG
jgi:PAS domain S-box-containing protein